MDRPLLTIVIPTFNRASYLDKCLNSICSQIEKENEIELIVANNASSDNTHSIVQKYIYNGNIIKYINRAENIGPDGNFADCFNEAKGKYFWIIGDDDFVLPDVLSKIIAILKEEDYGVIFLNGGISYSDEQQLQNIIFSTNDVLDKKVYTNSIEFFNEYNYWATFITGNIINRSLIAGKINPLEFSGTNLIQLGWNISSVFASKFNVIINGKTIVCKADNTGGYKLITVFCKNYNDVLKKLIFNGIDKRIKPITNNKLFASFFPPFIKLLLNTNTAFKKENHGFILLKEGWKYKSYWENIFPLYAKFYIRKILSFSKL